ncbi:hypothetical protein BTVI_151141 [Pitangus sulphuratus]|nr:hypothetical protein BTVI_151141 [Pitangus sulphuratus]
MAKLLARRAGGILEFTGKCDQQVRGDDPPPLLSPGEATSGILCPFLGSSVQERQGDTGQYPVEDTKMMRDLEHLSYEEILWELGLEKTEGISSTHINISISQLSDRGHTEREKQKENNNSIECSEPGTMDLKFASSRKYISISVPSKSQTMSPHIKSVDDVVVLGMNLSKFNKPTQFFICVSGVFMFYLIYGYLQELIFSVEGFKPFGWYLTLVQFGFYSIFGLIELQLIQDKRRRIPGKTYMIIAFLTVGTMGLSNTSLGYLNYPTQVIFKCCKLIPVMIGGVFIQGKRYNIVDVSAALCMSLGLIWFTLADSTVAPNFNLTGVVLISLALCADAVIGNVQEKAMKLHNGSNSEMHLVQTYGYAFLFSLTGYFGISFVLALIKIFGALLAVTVTTGRKAMTIVLSFLFFAKPFTLHYCMIDCVLDKVERYKFDEQIHLEREGWPAVTFHFRVTAKVLWQFIEINFSLAYKAEKSYLHFTDVEMVICPKLAYVKFYLVICITPVVLCPLLGSPPQERDGAMGESPAKGHEDDELEHLSYEEMLRELGLFILEKKQLRGVSSMCINIEGSVQRWNQALFSDA